MQIDQHLVLYHHADWYSSFPSLTRTADDRLLCGFRRAPTEPAGHSHVHSRSRAVFITSDDDGATWSDDVHYLCPQDELGQQDPQLMTTRDGRLIGSFFRWQAHAPSEQEHLATLHPPEIKGVIWSNAGLGVVTSDDHGATWSPLHRVPNPWHPRGGASRGPAVELPSGRLLLPAYDKPSDAQASVAYLMASDDGGTNWTYLSTMAKLPGDGRAGTCHEPMVVRAQSGRLLCFIRCYGEGGLMRMCHSDDHGLTWSDPVETEVWGFPQNALCLPDGRLLLTYGYRREPHGIRARLLDPDAGNVNEAAELVIRDDGRISDLGYPTAVLRRDGTVLVAYYIHDADDVTHIAGTILSL